MSAGWVLDRPRKRRIEKRCRKTRDARVWVRGRVVLLVAQGLSVAAAARVVGCYPAAAWRMVARFREHGEPALVDGRSGVHESLHYVANTLYERDCASQELPALECVEAVHDAYQRSNYVGYAVNPPILYLHTTNCLRRAELLAARTVYLAQAGDQEQSECEIETAARFSMAFLTSAYCRRAWA